MLASALPILPPAIRAFDRLAQAMAASRDLYRADRCNENVASLVRRVMTQDERLSAFVLIVTHGRAKTPELYWRNCFLLRPRAAVEGDIAWNHHTLALLASKVYDYDYRGEPGTPLGEYASAMFGEAVSRYVVREIPAEEYVLKYRTRDMIFGENYPRYLLSDYVAQE